ncbi:MAG: carboxypeptidase M32 [Treponema sp.]|jgi:carboxypeptidase Taq|nr:carboxypeptidase M32 [Treponema sp.]
MSGAEKLNRLYALDRERMYLSRAAAVLHWDEETCMPPRAVEERAEQLAVLEGLAHEKLTAPETGELLRDLGALSSSGVELPLPRNTEDAAGVPAGLPAAAGDFLRVLSRDYNRAARLPPEFVRESARAEGLSQAAWVEARKRGDFSMFAPHLKKMIDCAGKKAEYWGYGGSDAGGSAYDGLLDSFEPGMGEKEISALFDPLKKRVEVLLKKIAASPKPDTGFLHLDYDIQRQREFSRELLDGLGFDTSRGRLDESAHPFTTTLGFNDVRITTRYAENDPMSGIFSVIHEAGHAFYELAVDPQLKATCLAEGVSMGIHESQSRLWENVIGRSRAFWEGWFPALQARFPARLAGVTFPAFYRAVNAAGPSLIRTDADEVSYSLHIILRFDLERRLISGALSVDDAPAAWNAAFRELFGLEVPDDASGILQDVHWSMGSFGYFPSYALGNLYALQFWKKCRADIPRIEQLLIRREYAEIHAWFKEKIHVFGRRFDPAELLEKATGEKLSAVPFLEYLETKYADLYGF